MPKTIKITSMKTAYLEADIHTTGLSQHNADGAAPREIGVDEAGRGPMFGRVYTAAVILPTESDASAAGFKHDWMKDSKKFHSEKKIREVAKYIKENAKAWAIAYADETVIDKINIRNATHKAMHEAIKNVIGGGQNVSTYGVTIETAKPLVWSGACGGVASILLLIDGNDFTPYVDGVTKQRIQHVCIEGGDNTYSSIAAASILAKVARDDYIAELCAVQPELITKYDLLKNKGYGTKKHMDGIKTYGITANHRKTFGVCREYA